MEKLSVQGLAQRPSEAGSLLAFTRCEPTTFLLPVQIPTLRHHSAYSGLFFPGTGEKLWCNSSPQLRFWSWMYRRTTWLNGPLSCDSDTVLMPQNTVPSKDHIPLDGIQKRSLATLKTQEDPCCFLPEKSGYQRVTANRAVILGIKVQKTFCKMSFK